MKEQVQRISEIAREDFALIQRKKPLREEAITSWQDKLSNWPWGSLLILGLIGGGCWGKQFIMTKDPNYLDLLNGNQPPSPAFLFGTDPLGRDIFSMIWQGGSISLRVGILATAISLIIAMIYGALSGMAPYYIDAFMMRLLEILLSIPSLLLIIFIQAIWGNETIITISIAIGIASWMSMAKIIRAEVLQIRRSDFVIASRCMGGCFFHIMRRHLIPQVISSIMFMVVMTVRSAMIAEATLSFMGIGLPIEMISWGSMLSLAQRALLTQSWWLILIPGLFLVMTLWCLTNIGNAIRQAVNPKQVNL